MRQLVAVLAQKEGSQAKLARRLDIRVPTLAEYNTGMARGKSLSAQQLNGLYHEIDRALSKVGLPRTLDEATTPAAGQSGKSPTDSTEAKASPRTTAPVKRPLPPSSEPAKRRTAGPVLTLDLSEVAGRQGGQVFVMDLGTQHEPADPSKWTVEADGHLLQLRLGFRMRRTFGANVVFLGGRTFEWWIETLSAPAELAFDGGPLWVAREVTGMAEVATVFAKADVSGRIVGRAIGATGNVTGRSTPALLWRAVERHCGSEERKLSHPLVICGLTHPKVQQLFALAAPTQPPPANNSIGTRSGGLSGLKEGGRQLREIRRLAGDAFVQAMESVSPEDPTGVFAQLMKAPSFRNTYLPLEWRDGLTPAAIEKQMVETPFFASMVSVYHELKGFRAKRQHLALVAPFFPVKVASPTPSQFESSAIASLRIDGETVKVAGVCHSVSTRACENCPENLQKCM